MSYPVATLTAHCFRAVGADAYPTPPSNTDTLDLGGLHSSGEECLPHKITLGDFLRICREPGFEPGRAAFFMPMAHGPCRFGQYASYLRHVLNDLGYQDVLVISPTTADGYDGIGEHARELKQTVWLGIVAGDLLTRFVLKTRPYEINAGDADAVQEEGLRRFGAVLEEPGRKIGWRIRRLTEEIAAMRDRFRAVPAKYEKGRPLIGLVGEIFCRMNTFSNEDTARRIERLGGECWLSDLTEWVYYTNWWREFDEVRTRGRLNLKLLKQRIKNHFQHRWEHALLRPVQEDFVGYEEPHDITEVLDASEPYLPSRGALGEMVLSVGKTIYLYRKGADGALDISPFTCMNGIAAEAVYPAVSEDHDHMPIRSLTFDKLNTNLDRDLEIFLDLARAYQRRKQHARVYPACFG